MFVPFRFVPGMFLTMMSLTNAGRMVVILFAASVITARGKSVGDDGILSG